MSDRGSRVEVTREAVKGGDPELLVNLVVKPPLRYPDANPGHYTATLRHDWTLDALERTVIEFRAAGGWDGSKVQLRYGEVTCEVLTGRREDALPWGWVPSHGDPAPEQPPRFRPLADRRLHGVLLVLVLLLGVAQLVVTR